MIVRGWAAIPGFFLATAGAFVLGYLVAAPWHGNLIAFTVGMLLDLPLMGVLGTLLNSHRGTEGRRWHNTHAVGSYGGLTLQNMGVLSALLALLFALFTVSKLRPQYGSVAYLLPTGVVIMSVSCLVLMWWWARPATADSLETSPPIDGVAGMIYRWRHGPKPGEDITKLITLTRAEADHGRAHTLRYRVRTVCSACSGNRCHTGALSPCQACDGRGTRTISSGFSPAPADADPTVKSFADFLSRPFISDCAKCDGYGSIAEDPCRSCRGTGLGPGESRKLTVDIPAGVQEGAIVTVPGKGTPGVGRFSDGDLQLKIHVLFAGKPARRTSHT